MVTVKTVKNQIRVAKINFVGLEASVKGKDDLVDLKNGPGDFT